MLVFPTQRFPFNSRDCDIELASVSGGVAISGAEDVTYTDGGGRWVADMGDASLYSRDRIMLWRAFKSATNSGTDAFVFPVCDIRHQPIAATNRTTHSDGTPFADDTEYFGADTDVTASANAALRATSMVIDITAIGKPLIGGERFTIDHPTWRHRMYQIGTISGSTIQFNPPLREAVTAGTVIDFVNPRFVGRIESMSAPMSGPRWANGSVRIVEDLTGNYA